MLTRLSRVFAPCHNHPMPDDQPALPPAGAGPLSRPAEPATAYALSEATRRAYRADWQDFSAWCRAAGYTAR